MTWTSWAHARCVCSPWVFSSRNCALSLASASQGKDTAAICQALEISSQTYHRWKARYARIDGDEVKKLRELEEENAAPWGGGRY